MTDGAIWPTHLLELTDSVVEGQNAGERIGGTLDATRGECVPAMRRRPSIQRLLVCTAARVSARAHRATSGGVAPAVLLLGVLLLVSPALPAGAATTSDALAVGAATNVDAALVVPVSGGGATPQLAVGNFHTCVLLADSTMRCWGNNQSGRLGDGTTSQRNNPVQVLASGSTQGTNVLSGVVRIDAGGAHTCAVMDDTTLRCWGMGISGQLGDGATRERANPLTVLASGTASADPVPLTGVTAVATGSQHTCALLADTTVRCWGSGGSGRLGDGATSIRLNPVTVLTSGTATTDPVPLTGVVALSAGSSHTCALLDDTTVRCWGSGSSGQIGNGMSGGGAGSTHPVTVLASGTATTDPEPLTDVVAITAGSSHTCALLADATARCWGSSVFGQIGDGATSGRSNPVTVLASGTATSDPLPLTGVEAIAAGGRHTCALLSDTTARCWGRSDKGQIGDGAATDRLNPVTVLTSGTAAADPVSLTGVSTVAIGFDHSCSLLTDRTLRCWGMGDNGQLGDGAATDRLNPVTVLVSGTAVADPVPLEVGIAPTVDPGDDGDDDGDGDVGDDSDSDSDDGSDGDDDATGSSDPEDPATTRPRVACDTSAPTVGARITCTVTGGEAGVTILWRAAYNPVFAGEGVTLDADGTGSFAFTVPTSALGSELTVELIDWTGPLRLGVVGGPSPTRVAAGHGSVPTVPILTVIALAAVAGAALLGRRTLRAR